MKELTKESIVWTWRPQGIATTIHGNATHGRRSCMVVAIPCGRHAANGLRGAINLAPTEVARFAAAHNVVPTGRVAPEDGEGVH